MGYGLKIFPRAPGMTSQITWTFGSKDCGHDNEVVVAWRGSTVFPSGSFSLHPLGVGRKGVRIPENCAEKRMNTALNLPENV